VVLRATSMCGGQLPASQGTPGYAKPSSVASHVPNATGSSGCAEPMVCRTSYGYAAPTVSPAMSHSSPKQRTAPATE
jgi:hypothetical protein